MIKPADSALDMQPSCDEFFYILGFQRSGTSLIQALLGSRLDTNMFPRELWAANFFGSFLGSWITHQRQEYHLTRQVVSAMIPKPSTQPCFRGFKANVNGIQTVTKAVDGIEEGFLWMKGIALIRNDLVAQVASMSRARTTGRWHAWVSPELPHNQAQNGHKLDGKVMIKFDDPTLGYIISLILGQRSLAAFARRHDFPLIVYETDILDHPSVAIQKIESYLGMPAWNYEFDRFQKVSPPPEDYVLNYEEAKDLVAALQSKTDADLLAMADKMTRRVAFRQKVFRVARLPQSLARFVRGG